MKIVDPNFSGSNRCRLTHFRRSFAYLRRVRAKSAGGPQDHERISVLKSPGEALGRGCEMRKLARFRRVGTPRAVHRGCVDDLQPNRAQPDVLEDAPELVR